MPMVPFIAGLVRHIMTFAGGYVVANGLSTQSEWETVIAGTVAAVGVGWSAVQKKGLPK